MRPMPAGSRAAGTLKSTNSHETTTMSKVRFSTLMILGAALAACSNNETSRTMTAPNAHPAFSEAPADLSVGYTADGPFDLVSPIEGASAQLAASAPQSASG